MTTARDGAAPVRGTRQRRILGIDPGLARTGYGVIAADGRRVRALGYGAVAPPARLDIFDRLKFISDGLAAVIAELEPVEMAVEEIFHHRNVRAALSLGHARGAAIVAGMNRGLKPHQYTPMQVKKAVVGYGRADKTQVQEMIRMLLGLKEVPTPDDASDALAVALTHFFWTGGNLG